MTTQGQKNYIKRYAKWIFCILIIGLCGIYFGSKEYKRYTMKALNCTQLSALEFDKLLAENLAVPAYAPQAKEKVSPVTFQFNLEPSLLSDTVMFMRSFKLNQMIYRSIYQPKFTIQANQEILQGKSENYDDFEFLMFNKKTLELCNGIHESTIFWAANKTVRIDFLDQPRLNKYDRPERFQVRIE
jgi:hypothetical protein